MVIYNDGKKEFTLLDKEGKKHILNSKKTVEVKDDFGKDLIGKYWDLKDADKFTPSSSKSLRAENEELKKRIAELEAGTGSKKSAAKKAAEKKDAE